MDRRSLKTLTTFVSTVLALALVTPNATSADEPSELPPTAPKTITLDGKEVWVYSDLVLSNFRGMSSWGLQICGNLEPNACARRVRVLISNPNVVSQTFMKEEGDDVATVMFSAEQEGTSLVCLKGFGNQAYWNCKTLIVLPVPVYESRTGYGLTVPKVRVPIGMSLQFYDDMRERSNRSKMSTSNRSVLPEGQISNFFTFRAKKPGKSRLCIKYPRNVNPRFYRSNCQTITVIR